MEVSDFFKEVAGGFFKRLDESYLDEAGRKLVKRATCFAATAHSGFERDSGEPFITHPIAVAELLLKIGRSTEEIVAGVLHDVVEDTKISLAEIEEHFGRKIAFLVDGMTKVPRPMNIKEIKTIYGQAVISHVKRLIGAEVFKSLSSVDKVDKNVIYEAKLYAMIPKDPRLVFVRLADRLHNMRTLESLLKERQKKLAKETLEFHFNLVKLFLSPDELTLIGPWMEELKRLSGQYLELNPEMSATRRSLQPCLSAI